ncbi:uncharacterized protein BCR38DRAFT_159139 [Pseudomassariella vexata]|uniref:Uncharacterized protein n=1 Tax=Pseudomassariella vexata TaxID=1141098 RepID=A0A1Y2E7G5_9PEZI|nr:uncharacterized protein BCR38DRAFT_159139 [Pseudomassariella vexata]ORY67482.1 hypothetical protein BCR38DRAFT_159139 [Pseudomassariella vexata]
MPSRNQHEEGEYMGNIGSMPCYRCKLRGNGLTDPNSNWRLWNADMKVYRDGTGDGDPDEVFANKEEEILAKMDRRRKAFMWFSVSESLREQHLTDLGGKNASSEDVFRRLHERVAPPGTAYKPLEKLVITEQMRADIKKAGEAVAAKKSTP